MSEELNRIPMVDQFYRDCLNEEVSSRFIKNVSEHYTVETLERLAVNGGVVSRRSSILALGFLGSMSSNEVVARALNDPDRAVRMLAEHGIREIWMRDGSFAQQQELQVLARLNRTSHYSKVVKRAKRLIKQAPHISEAWNQRGIAHFNLNRFEESLVDCQQAVNYNSYHFSAIVGQGHCFLNLDMSSEAVECFERALEIHPGLDAVRTHLHHLKKQL